MGGLKYGTFLTLNLTDEESLNESVIFSDASFPAAVMDRGELYK